MTLSLPNLRIRNWDKWQSYRKDRGQPPWIKIHRQVMRDPNWVALSDAERGQLVAMWLLAADRGGVIPASPTTIKKLCYLDNEPNIQLFVDKGFIESDATVTPSWRHDDAPETETETETEERRGEERRGDGADAPASGWHGFVVHLNAKDFPLWTKTFSHIDLPAELMARDVWLTEQDEATRKKWFQSTSKYLANRNMEAKAKGDAARAPPASRLSRTQQASVEYLEEIRTRGTNRTGRRGICGPRGEHVAGELLEPAARPKNCSTAVDDGLYWEAKISVAKNG